MLIIMFDTKKTAVFTRLRKGNKSNIMSFINSDSWTTEGSINLFYDLGIVVALLIYF